MDDLHSRNQSLHETTQELDQRLAEMTVEVERLKGRLAPLSAEWAFEASHELDVALTEARTKMADLTAVTGFDWAAMARAAREAIDELGAVEERVSHELRQRERSSADSEAGR